MTEQELQALIIDAERWRHYRRFGMQIQLCEVTVTHRVARNRDARIDVHMQDVRLGKIKTRERN